MSTKKIPQDEAPATDLHETLLAAAEAAHAVLGALVVGLKTGKLATSNDSTPRFADAQNNPIGSARAFADAARAGHFPTFRRSRRVCARWSDVERWIESRPHKRRAPKPTEPVDDEDPRAMLLAAGVKLKGAAR